LTAAGSGDWYHAEAFEGLDAIDVAYLGGPHWAIAPQARDRTLARLLPLLAGGGRILVPVGDSLIAESWALRASGDEGGGRLIRQASGTGTLRMVLVGR